MDLTHSTPSLYTRDTVVRRIATRSSGGFALIIALVIMSFLILLLLSLGTLTKVNIQNASIEQSQQEARQNALLAMNIALAELQFYAGDDQRITATAILGEPDTFANANSTAHQTARNGLKTPKHGARHWTGVWGNPDPAELIYTRTPMPVLLNWLVSGNEGTPVTASNGQITSPSTSANNMPHNPDGALPADPSAENLGDWARLVGKGSANATSDYVVAPLVNIVQDGSQRYAWWVGDEGVKARYDLRDPHDTTGNASTPANTTISDRYRMLLSQRNGIETVSGLGNYPINPIGGDTSLIDSVLTRQQIALSISGIGANTLKARFHDIALNTLGVLADSQRGGLRRDLSHALHHGSLSGKILPQVTQSGVPENIPAEINKLTNPRWELLNTFYTQVKDSIGSGNVSPATGDKDTHHITPVVLQIRTLVRLRVEAANAPENNRRLFLGAAPLIVLGNPYNVPLTSDGVDFRYHSEGGRNGRNDATPVSFKLRKAASSPGSFIPAEPEIRMLKRYDDAPAERSLLGNIVLRTPPFTIPPGETIAFFLKDNSVATGAGLHVAELTSDIAQLDTERAVDVQIGEATADALNSTGVSNSWQLVTLAPSWGHFSFSMYEAAHNVSDPMAQRPLQRIEQVGLGSATMQNHTFSPPDKDLNVTAHTDPAQRLNDDFYASYFYRLFHMITPQIRFASQRLYSQYNIRAQLLRRPLVNNNGSHRTNPLFYVLASAQHGTAADNAYTNNLPARWGNSIDTSGAEKVVLFDMQHSGDSAAPLLSVAALRHANLGFIMNANNASANLPTLTGVSNSMTHDMSVGETSGSAIGNSWSNPYIRRKFVAEGRKLNDTSTYETQYDTSYLLNAALFDGHFFSTVPQGSGATLPEHLPNARMLPRSSNLAMLQSTEDAAAHLMLKGAFNVNSASVEAWKAILSGMRFNNTESLYLRSLNQPGGNRGNEGVLGDIYSGYRTLNTDETEALAEAIVSEVRKRGPFQSLGHFINRKIESGVAQNSDPLALKGALQSALDKATTTPGGNTLLNDPQHFNNAVSPVSEDNIVYADPAAAIGAQSAGAPGWLSQADLLQALAPMLATRSDTFIIRAYGEVRNPASNVVESRAWCEALVQRLPDPVTPLSASSPYTPSDELGRRFEIIEFRWLNEDDV